MLGTIGVPSGEAYGHLPAQSAFGSWRARIGSYPFPVAISASGDRSLAPWVNTESNEAPPRQLQAGSDLNKTAEGPWPFVINPGSDPNNQSESGVTPSSWTVGMGRGNAGDYTPNSLRQPYHVNMPGNFGMLTSRANFGWRNWLFNANEPLQPAIGNLPGPIPDARRPMWQVLPAAQYNVRVVNPNTNGQDNPYFWNNANAEQQNAYSLSFTPTGVASLNATGATQSEVLL